MLVEWDQVASRTSPRASPPGHVVTELALLNYGRFMAAIARCEEAERTMLEAHGVLDGGGERSLPLVRLMFLFNDL
jgi:hypothetical protein